MILIVTAHPVPESFTAAVTAALSESLGRAGVDTVISDLYRSESGRPFPPLLDAEELRRKTSLDTAVQNQMSLVEKAGGYVVVHPDWWGGPPAVLKGWLDRVLRPGTAYEVPETFGPGEPVGLLKGRCALVIVSGESGGPGPLEEFWNERVWGFCGVRSELMYLPRMSELPRSGREDFIRSCTETATGMFG